MESNYDACWRERALGGDRAAIDRLANKALAPLYRFCFYRVGGDRHVCEEVVQETLYRAIGGLARYDPDRCADNIFPWLTGLARNEIKRVLSREKAIASLVQLWQRMDDDLRRIFAALDSEPLDEDVLRREETREMVGATMSQLPAHYRQALEEKYVLGKSVRDIAAALRVSEKTIESKLTRARKAFRETFRALAKNLSLDVISSQ